MWVLLLALLGPAQAAETESERSYAASHQVPQTPGLLLRWDPARSWGTSQLVDTLKDVARRLAFEIPHADPLLVGDVSKRGGGALDGHVTHHLGMDADVGLYTGEGQQPLGGFLEVDPRRLDLASNWALVRALLDTEAVAYVLLDQSHIDRLKAYARDEIGLDADTLERIFPSPEEHISWDRFGVVRHAPNHRDHLHVRVQSRPGT